VTGGTSPGAAPASQLLCGGVWETDGPAPRPDWRSLSEQAGIDQRDLRAACRRHRYTRGETIFHEGDPAGAFHLLDVGHVAIRQTTLRGDMSIIDVLQPGDTFGEQVLIRDEGDRSASATAIERVETLALDAARARSLHDLPGVDRFLLMVVGGRLQETTRQLLEARYVPAGERLLRCIGRLAEQFSVTTGTTTGMTPHDAVIPLSQADIASMVGVTRSTANRMLREAEANGLLEIARGRIRVNDIALLRRRSDLT
jgi:CRP/FNR family cyclic AMP-dependent transcriptional regulator